MVKLDVSNLRHMSKEEFRVLTAVEMGMKNHQLVPMDLIIRIAALRHGGVHKLMNNLMRNKLVVHEAGKREGYRLTYSGYDYLALRVLVARGLITGVGSQIGVGKESDIFAAQSADGDTVAIKFHRLGRTSFRDVKNKRDYLQGRKKSNWLYLSRLAALKEFAFMKALHGRGFPTPTPIDQNRHVVLMSLVEGVPLYQVKRLTQHKSEFVYEQAMALILRLTRCGLIHCDFNEFNLMVDEDRKVTMIDFPQMISTSHINAQEYFDRDVASVVRFFGRLQTGGFSVEEVPSFAEAMSNTQDCQEGTLDVELQASGFTADLQRQFESLTTFTSSTSAADGNAEDESCKVRTRRGGRRKGRRDPRLGGAEADEGEAEAEEKADAGADEALEDDVEIDGTSVEGATPGEADSMFAFSENADTKTRRVKKQEDMGSEKSEKDRRLKVKRLLAKRDANKKKASRNQTKQLIKGKKLHREKIEREW